MCGCAAVFRWFCMDGIDRVQQLITTGLGRLENHHLSTISFKNWKCNSRTEINRSAKCASSLLSAVERTAAITWCSVSLKATKLLPLLIYIPKIKVSFFPFQFIFLQSTLTHILFLLNFNRVSNRESQDKHFIFLYIRTLYIIDNKL